jgi:hypothetical protein
MKRVLIVIGLITLIGLMGRLECQDEIKSAEYDKQMKQEVIKQWEQRCSNGDIFDVDICRVIMK